MRISWKEVDRLVDELEVQIRPAIHKITNIYGIPRGGLIPAVMLSHRLEKPLILKEEEIDPMTLVVDELVDSGEQFLALEERLSVGRGIVGLQSAVLHHKRHSKFTPLYRGEVIGPEYVTYSWELDK